MNFSLSARDVALGLGWKLAPLPLAPWTKNTTGGLLLPLGTCTTLLRAFPATWKGEVHLRLGDTGNRQREEACGGPEMAMVHSFSCNVTACSAGIP